MTFDRFFRHLIRLHQDRLQLDTLGATASHAVGQRAVNLHSQTPTKNISKTLPSDDDYNYDADAWTSESEKDQS
jgi:hypothetical protein